MSLCRSLPENERFIVQRLEPLKTVAPSSKLAVAEREYIPVILAEQQTIFPVTGAICSGRLLEKRAVVSAAS